MNLSKLPVLIRTEVSEAAKSAGLPAVYSRALVALEEAVTELSFDKLKQIDVSAEGLAAWAKAHQDTKMSKTARELKYRARRAALYIAEKLSAKRKAEFVRPKGFRGHPPGVGIQPILREAGYNRTEVGILNAVRNLPDTPEIAQLKDAAIKEVSRGKGRLRASSDFYHAVFSLPHSPFIRARWCRENNARGIARQLTDPAEIQKAKEKVTLVRAWCDEFLKNLPRTVSKAKVEK
jgi:hypothetical protein